MFGLDVNFELEASTEDKMKSAVRIWVDSAELPELDDGIELPVKRIGNTWTAHFEDKHAPSSACFWLRLAIVGTPGTRWQLNVQRRGRGRERALLMRDADELSLPKEWIVTTCHGAVGNQHLAVVA